MSKYPRMHYKDIGRLLGKSHAPKSEIDAWVKKFKEDNPRFKPKTFKDWVKKYR